MPKANINPGLKFAGTIRCCRMDIDVYTSSGKLPLWAGAPDPELMDIATSPGRLSGKDKGAGKSVPFYVITDDGKKSIESFDASVTDEMYRNIMRVLSVIDVAACRQIDISQKIELDQRKVWYIIQKTKKMGLIKEIEGVV